MAGKGDTPRPTDFKKYTENYERIFRGNSDRPDNVSVQTTTQTQAARREKAGDPKPGDP